MVASGHCLLLGETLPVQALQKHLGTSQRQVPGEGLFSCSESFPYPVGGNGVIRGEWKHTQGLMWKALRLPAAAVGTEGFGSALCNSEVGGAREGHRLQCARLCQGNQLVASSKSPRLPAEALRLQGRGREGTQQFSSSVSLNSAAIR